MQDAPFYADIADGPVGGAAYWLTTADGLRIRVGLWPQDKARGTVLIFPGRTEFVEKYGQTAKALSKHGYACLAVDWRGQGLADRMIANRAVGHVARFADYQHDVAAIMAFAAARQLPEPYFLLGHSMGGCIGLRSVIERDDIQAVMFSAPMWGVQMAAALRPLAWGVSAASMALGFDHILSPGQSADAYVMRVSFDDNTLTGDRETFAMMQNQMGQYPDLRLGGPSLRWLHLALREMYRLRKMPSPDIPCLTFLGAEEAIVDPHRIHHRMQGWPGGTLRVIDGGKHEMLMDVPDMRNQVIAETVAFFDKSTDVATPQSRSA